MLRGVLVNNNAFCGCFVFIEESQKSLFCFVSCFVFVTWGKVSRNLCSTSYLVRSIVLNSISVHTFPEYNVSVHSHRAKVVNGDAPSTTPGDQEHSSPSSEAVASPEHPSVPATTNGAVDQGSESSWGSGRRILGWKLEQHTYP